MLENFPYWRRRAGADHAWLTTSDRGGCHIRGVAELDAAIAITHYVRKTPPEPCGDPVRDIAFPPLLPDNVTALLLAASGTPTSARTLSFFFAGKVPEHDKVDERRDALLLRHAYSEGARQLAWKHLRSTPHFRIVLRSKTYAHDYLDARVCLAALGQGWGIRFLWALAAGCIPLLPSSKVSFTFESSLNFSHFSFPHYPASALPELPAFLRRAGHERLAALQASLRVHTPLFLWPPHGIAHRMMLRELCQRAPAILISPERLAQCATLLPAAEQFPALRAIRHPDPPPLVPRSISRGRGPESRQGQPTAHKY